MQKKSCSNCSTQVYVACKTCPSCQQPFPKTGPIAVIMSEYEGLFRRRTERIKREKPNYYDASAFNNRKNPKKTTTKKEKEDKAASKEKTEKPNKKPCTANLSTKDNKREKETGHSVPLPPPTATQSSKDESKDSSPKPRRKKLMKTKVSKDTEEETYNSIMNTQQSAQQCNIILTELNRKLFSTSWRGI